MRNSQSLFLQFFVLAVLVSCGEVRSGKKSCGNGKLDDREACDGKDVKGQTCQSLGYLSGTLACDSRCHLDKSGCQKAVSLSVGSSHVCAVLSDGTVWCWGSNSNGELGAGATGKDSLLPVQVAGLEQVKKVSCQSNYSCALLKDGRVKCWGSNSSGELGDGPRKGSHSPVVVKGLTDVVQVATGSGHACAVRKDGSAWCWGDNMNGQLGNGNTSESSGPGPVVDLRDAVSISAGSIFTCAVLKDGSGRCWGRNGDDPNADTLDGPRHFGVLGNDFKGMTSRPLPVDKLAKALSISAGSTHACAALQSGKVMCWGVDFEPCGYNSDEDPDGEKCRTNRSGILGMGEEAYSSKNVTVKGLDQVIGLSAGDTHTCALQKGGEVWCWGFNYSGEVGTGNKDEQRQPVRVKNLTEVVEVSAGSGLTCVLLKTGRIQCWGNNSSGQIGDGTTTDRLVPVDVVFGYVLPRDAIADEVKPVAKKTLQRPVSRGDYSVTSSGALKPAAGLTYYAENAVDDDLSTWWTPSPNRDGKGAWLRLDFQTSKVISGFEILGGSRYENFPKHGDLWEKNNRLIKAQVHFSGGKQVTVTLDPEDKVQKIEFPPVETRHLVLYPESWIPGSKWNDLCISLIRPLELVTEGDPK